MPNDLLPKQVENYIQDIGPFPRYLAERPEAPRLLRRKENASAAPAAPSRHWSRWKRWHPPLRFVRQCVARLGDGVVVASATLPSD
jgi:hypothetical protein